GRRLSVLRYARSPPALLVPSLRAVLSRPRRPAETVLAALPGPARTAVVLGFPVVLQRRQHLRERAARISAARVPARSLHLDRGARTAEPRRALLAGVGADRACRFR